jgi:formylglycine-generating enzyme required for sulfatase activity
LDYRLPTEAEWEYAARGGTGGSRFWLGGPDKGCDHGNGAGLELKERFADWPWAIADCDDGALYTAPGGSYRRNGFGLSDMAGNAWEWVQDCWHDSYMDAPEDGSAWLGANAGDCARRVVRGGGWNGIPRNLRSADRLRDVRDARNAVLGFRLARTLP